MTSQIQQPLPMQMRARFFCFSSEVLLPQQPGVSSQPAATNVPQQDRITPPTALDALTSALQAAMKPVVELLRKIVELISAATRGSDAPGAEVAPSPVETGSAVGVDNNGISTEAAVGGAASGPFDAGFLWKPQSSKAGKEGGKLVVLFPAGVTGDIRSVELRAPGNKTRLSAGTFAGIANGQREHWRFPKSGGEYPDRSVLRVTLEDGSVRTKVITAPSERLQSS